MKATTTEHDTWLHKLLFLAFFLLGMAAVLNAQVASNGSNPQPDVVVVDENPTITNWRNVLNNLEYPDECFDQGLEGTVDFKMLIEVDGRVIKVDIPETVHPAFAKAIEKVMPQVLATPGKYKGKAIKTWYPVKVTFDLDEEKKRRKKEKKNARKGDGR